MCGVFYSGVQNSHPSRNTRQQFGIQFIPFYLYIFGKIEQRENLQGRAPSDMANPEALKRPVWDKTYTKGFTDHKPYFADLNNLQIPDDRSFSEKISGKIATWSKENKILTECCDNLLRKIRSLCDELKRNETECQRAKYKLQMTFELRKHIVA